MTWIVDVDGHPECRGAIRFAVALARESATPGEVRVVPVHVLEDEHLRAVLRLHHLDEVLAAERERAQGIVRQAAPATPMDVELVQARDEEQGLAWSREARHADGVIVPRGEARLGRLRGVARRLVRRPPCPVIVVPTGPSSAELDGPVVALTDLHAGSTEAYLFAAKMARQAGRRVVAFHALAGAGAAARREPPRGSSGVDEGAVLAWAAACGAPADRAAVARGEVVEEALAYASRHRALLLVAGWHRRRGLAGVLGRHLGRALAVRATRPVAIVPPDRAPVEAAARLPGVREPLHA